MSERKAVIKNADMSEEMQQDAVDCATQALEKYNIEKVCGGFLTYSENPSLPEKKIFSERRNLFQIFSKHVINHVTKFTVIIVQVE